MTTTSKPKNYDASPAHAKRAKVGDKLGTMSRYDPESGERTYVNHAYYEVVKVHEDGALTVKTPHSNSRKTLKPDTYKSASGGSRLAWYYTETQPYRSNVYLFIENARDREMQAREEAIYEGERQREKRAKAGQRHRNKPLYEKLVAFADARGLLVKSASMGEVEIGQREYDGQTHADLDTLLPSWDVKLDLACSGIQVPIEMFLSLANIKD